MVPVEAVSAAVRGAAPLPQPLVPPRPPGAARSRRFEPQMPARRRGGRRARRRNRRDHCGGSCRSAEIGSRRDLLDGRASTKRASLAALVPAALLAEAMTPRAHPTISFVRTQDCLGGALGVNVEHEDVASLTETRLVRVRSANRARPRGCTPPGVAVEELLGVHDVTAVEPRRSRSRQTPEPRSPARPKQGTSTGMS